MAAERAEALGVTVGYQIRMEAMRSEKTRLMFWCDPQARHSPVMHSAWTEPGNCI